MKVTKDQIKETVRKVIRKKLDEEFNFSNDLVPDDIAAYAKKVDEFLKDTIQKARDLHDEGEEMMRSNAVLSNYETQERNRFLLYRVGFLNSLVANLIHRLEDEYRQ